MSNQREVIDKVAAQMRTSSATLLKLSKELEDIGKSTSPIKLNVPYMSQWGPGANKRRGDCGPATVAMLVNFLTTFTPTVDQAAEACNQPRTGRGSFFTTVHQLRTGLRKYRVANEVAAPYHTPSLSLNLLMGAVDRGRPSIALIDYKLLRELTNPLEVVHNQDQGYNFGHWIVFVGYDSEGVFMHDSDFWGSREQEGAFRWIPYDAFVQALESPAQGNKYGSTGIIVA